MPYFSISELADRFGCPPKAICDLFFRRVLDPTQCIVKSGRKLIPETYVPQVERALRRGGKVHAS